MKIDFTFGLAARIRDWFRPKATLIPRAISGRSLPAGETVVYRFGVFGPTVTAIDAGPDWTFIDDADSTEPVAVSGYAGWTVWENIAEAGSIHASVDQSRYPATPSQKLWGQYSASSPNGFDVTGLTPGTYRVIVYAREHWSPYSEAGQRVYTIALNGGAPTTVDLAGDFGQLTLGAIDCGTVAVTEDLTITFASVVEAPTWDSIEIISVEDTAAPRRPSRSMGLGLRMGMG